MRVLVPADEVFTATESLRGGERVLLLSSAGVSTTTVAIAGSSGGNFLHVFGLVDASILGVSLGGELSAQDLRRLEGDTFDAFLITLLLDEPAKPASDGNTLRIAEGGVVSAGGIGVALTGPQQLVSNFGTIGANGYGIFSDAEDATIFNDGTVFGDTGLRLHGTARLINDGVIGGRVGIEVSSQDSVSILNRGHIEGGVVEESDGLAVSILSSASKGVLRNTGEIVGDVSVPFSVKVFNSGSISGDVEAVEYVGRGGQIAGNLDAGAIIGGPQNLGVRFDLRESEVLKVVSGSNTTDRFDLRDAVIGQAVLGLQGDDTYLVNDAAIPIFEAQAFGRDSVVAYVDYALRDNFEDLNLRGDALIGQGNTLDNRIVGNISGNILLGEGGDDRIFGGAGDDVLSDGTGIDLLFGGAGADIFVFTADGDVDVVKDFEVGVDRLDVSLWGALDLSDLAVTELRSGLFRVAMAEEFLFLHADQDATLTEIAVSETFFFEML